MRFKYENITAMILQALLIIAALLLSAGEISAGETPSGLSGEEVFGYAKTLSEFGPRRPGTDAYEQAGDHIIGLMREFGCRVWTDSIPTNQYFPERWSLEVVSSESRALETFPMRFSAPTGPGCLTADLVDVGKGRESDFQGRDVSGKVVLVKWGHRILNLISMGALRDSYQRAVENGAAGYILYFTNTPGNSYQLMTADVSDGKPAIPGFSIGKEDAAYLKKLLGKSEVKINLSLKSGEREVGARNIFAVLPGRTDDVILVDTHYCSMFAGAVDNASGVAVALGLAGYFSRRPVEEREKTLVFCFYGTHEYVDYKLGAKKFLAENPKIADKAVVAIGLDHMAAYPDKEYFGGDTRIHPMTPLPGMDQPRGVFMSKNPALARIVLPALIRHRLFPSVMLPNGLMDAIKFGESEGDSLLDWCICETGPPYRMGVPILRATMAPQWYHTPLDTVLHFSPEQLKRVSDFHAEIIEGIDRTPPEKLAGKAMKK